MKVLIKKIFSNEFSRGGIFLTAASFFINILNYLFNIIAARALGPSGFGELTAFISYTTIISVPVTVTSVIFIQKISAAGDKRFTKAKAYERFFSESIRKWWYIWLVFLALIPFTPRVTGLSPISAYTLIPFFFISFLSIFYSSALQGLRLFLAFSLLSLFTALIKLAGAVAVFFKIDGLATVLLFLMISNVTSLIAGHLIIKRFGIKNGTEQDTKRFRLLSFIKGKQFIVTTLSILALTLFNNIDVIFVKRFFSGIDAGIYASWSLFSKIILYSIAPLIQVSFVFFSSQKQKDKELYALKASLIGLLFVAIGSFIVYTYFGRFITALFFGEKFLPVVPFLSLASLFGSFYTALYFIYNYLLAKKSLLTLLLVCFIPIYFVILAMFGTSLQSVMRLTVISSGSFLILSLVSLFWERKRSV